MKLDVGEEVRLVDGTRGKVIGVVTRRHAAANQHRMVQFENGLSGTYPVSELLPVKIVDASEATEPVKPSKPSKTK